MGGNIEPDKFLRLEGGQDSLKNRNYLDSIRCIFNLLSNSDYESIKMDQDIPRFNGSPSVAAVDIFFKNDSLKLMIMEIIKEEEKHPEELRDIIEVRHYNTANLANVYILDKNKNIEIYNQIKNLAMQGINQK